jgi:hypothetical protein
MMENYKYWDLSGVRFLNSNRNDNTRPNHIHAGDEELNIRSSRDKALG